MRTDKNGSLSGRILTNRNLVLFFALTAVVCAAAMLLSGRMGDGRTAVVRKNGEMLYEIDLQKVDAPYTLNVGGNVLLVEKGQISVKSADCPDGLCIKQGPISKPSQTIVCLPNRLTITIESDGGEPITDAIVK